LSAVCTRGAWRARAATWCPVLPRKQCGKQVLWLDEPVVVAEGKTPRVRQRLLELGRQFVETHVVFRLAEQS
jgi:hypothetical protein